MRVLVVGAGGREYAIAWQLSLDSRVKKIYIDPGNGGTERLAENVLIDVNDFKGLADFATENKIDLTIVCLDNLLADGIVDYFQKRGLPIFGPPSAVAQIEASKEFGRKVAAEKSVPSPKYRVFRQFIDAFNFIHSTTTIYPLVIKEDGLARGKGVTICHKFKDALDLLKHFMLKENKVIIIEEYLEGEELSLHAFSDGKTSILLPPVRDHKKLLDGDEEPNPNTGGMGVIGPIEAYNNADFLQQTKQTFVDPVLEWFNAHGTPFVGCLFPGLMLTMSGSKLLEYNCRPGDPETQAFTRLLKTPLLDIMLACIGGTLNRINIEWHPGFVACIVLASEGYGFGDDYKKGFPITGIEEAEKIPDIVVMHAGTIIKNNTLCSNGGRVLNVTSVRSTLQGAIASALEATELISYEGKIYRRDFKA